jgi:hypothetical protein
MTHVLIRIARALNSEWLEALASEAAQCPTRRSRGAWMLGGARLLVLALLRTHGLMIASFAAAAAAVLVLGLAGTGSNPAVARNRIELPLLLVVLALLPALARSVFGPVRAERAARAVRIVGYLVLLALITAKSVEARDGLRLGNYFQISKIGPLQAGLWLLICAYAAILLYATSRRVPLKPRTLTLAVVAGAVAGSAYFLRYGLHLWAWHVGWLCLCFVSVPVLVGFAGARLATTARVPPRHGAAAAVITGLTAALVLAVLAASTVAISPSSAPLHSLPCSPCVAPHAAVVDWSLLVATTPASMLLLAAPLLALCAGALGACLTLVQAPWRVKP